MNEENTVILPSEEQAEQNDRDTRAEELESTFSYDGYQVVRKELFAHLRDPAIVIRKDSITFNTACITGLEDVVYVHVMFNSDLKRIVVRGCDENDKDALRWCVAKPDKRKSRKMSCKPLPSWSIRRWAGIANAGTRCWDTGSPLRVKPCMSLICSCLRFSMKDRDGRKVLPILRITHQKKSLQAAERDFTRMILRVLLACL